MGQINDLAAKVHKNAIQKGWYNNGAAQNMGERLALIHAEVSEALEADRNHEYSSDTPIGVEFFVDDETYKE